MQQNLQLPNSNKIYLQDEISKKNQQNQIQNENENKLNIKMEDS